MSQRICREYNGSFHALAFKGAAVPFRDLTVKRTVEKNFQDKRSL